MTKCFTFWGLNFSLNTSNNSTVVLHFPSPSPFRFFTNLRPSWPIQFITIGTLSLSCVLYLLRKCFYLYFRVALPDVCLLLCGQICIVSVLDHLILVLCVIVWHCWLSYQLLLLPWWLLLWLWALLVLLPVSCSVLLPFFFAFLRLHCVGLPVSSIS